MIHTAHVHSKVFLHPGEFHFGAAPEQVGTLLGSCVAITVWHPFHHVGGMCHILLPERKRPDGAPLDGRYANEAVELFAKELKTRLIQPGSCQVKLFGGGNMFAGTKASRLDIGQRNIEAARQALARYGFMVMVEHVGGDIHRRLFLDLQSGDVWLATPKGGTPQGKGQP